MLNRRTFLAAIAVCRLLSGRGIESSTRIAAAQDDARKVAPFGDVTVISGNARERGRQYGKRFRTASTSSWTARSTRRSMASRRRKMICCATPVRVRKSSARSVLSSRTNWREWRKDPDCDWKNTYC